MPDPLRFIAQQTELRLCLLLFPLLRREQKRSNNDDEESRRDEVVTSPSLHPTLCAGKIGDGEFAILQPYRERNWGWGRGIIRKKLHRECPPIRGIMIVRRNMPSEIKTTNHAFSTSLPKASLLHVIVKCYNGKTSVVKDSGVTDMVSDNDFENRKK